MTSEWKESVFVELAQVVVDLMLLNLFPVPSSGKWTKTGPSTQRFTTCFLNGVLGSVVSKALGHLEFSEKHGECDLDTSFVEWSRTASKASNVCLAFLSCSDERAMVVILMVVDEPFRLLTLILMSLSSHEPIFEAHKPSPIQILASDSRSPVYSALCHLSGLLAGASSRLKIIYTFRSVANASEWLDKFPQDCDICFRACCVGMATIQRRQRDRLAKLSIQLFTMGDPLMPEHCVDEIAMRAATSHTWQLSPGLETRFCKRHQDKFPQDTHQRLAKVASSIKGDRQMLGDASWGLIVSVFPCERAHSYNRRFAREADQTRTLTSVAASSTTHQLVENQKWHVEACLVAANASPIDAAHVDELGAQQADLLSIKPLFKKKMPAEHFHRADWIQRKLDADPRFNCVSADAWAECKRHFGQISEADRSRFTSMSEGTKAIAAGSALAIVQEATSLPCDVVAFKQDCKSAPLGMLLATGSHFLLLGQSSPTAAWESVLAGGIRAGQCKRPLDTSIISALLFSDRARLPPPFQKLLNEATLCFPRSLGAASSFFSKCAMQLPPQDKHSMPSGKTFKTRQARCYDKASTTARVLDMRDKLVAKFAAIAKLGGPARGVGGRDMFLALERFSDQDCGPAVLPVFLHMSDAKDRSAQVEPCQNFSEYEHVTTDYVKLASRGLEPELCNGMIIAPSRETMVESWGTRYPHPFGELRHAPLKSFPADVFAYEIASQCDRVKIHRLATELVFHPGRGFCRFVTGTSITWEIIAFAPEVPAVVDDGSHFDMLADHPHMHDVSVEVEEVELQGAERPPDSLAQWLEQLMTEHGQLLFVGWLAGYCVISWNRMRQLYIA